MKPLFLTPLAFTSLLFACAPATQQATLQPNATVFTNSGLSSTGSASSGVSGLASTTLPTTRTTCSGTGYGFASQVPVDLTLTADNQASTVKGVLSIDGDTHNLTGFEQSKPQGVYYSLTGSPSRSGSLLADFRSKKYYSGAAE